MNDNGFRWLDGVVIALLALGVLMLFIVIRQQERLYQRQVETIDRLEEFKRGGLAAAAPRAAMPVDQATSPAAPAAASAGERLISGPQSGFPQGGTLIQKTEEPSTLNFFTSNEGSTRRLALHILEPLFSIHPDTLEPDPRLATSWEVSPDKLHYTFHLRQGVKWSDGEPFTADDVIFTYNMIMDPKVDSAHLKPGFMDIEKVEKIDPYTVVFTYKKPYFRGLLVCGYDFVVAPKHWYEKEIRRFAAEKKLKYSVTPGTDGFGEVFNQLRYPSVGTGALIFPADGWKTGQYIKFEKNYDYWGYAEGLGYNIDRLIYRVIRDETTSMEEMRKQQLDVDVVDYDVWLDQLSKDPTITNVFDFYKYDHTGIGYNFICWNCRQAPFNDKRVRQAMTLLIDRETMLAKFNRGNGQVVSGVFKPIYPEYSQDLKPLPFDPPRARELLREAGWKDSDGDGLLDKDGKPFIFEFKVPSGRVEYVRFGSFIQEEMARSGIEMTIVQLEWSVFIEDFYQHRFDSICLYHGSDIWPDPYDGWHSSQDVPRGGNSAGLHNAEIDDLLTRARTEFDRTERVKLYHRFNEIILDEQPFTLLFTGQVPVLVNKKFQNVKVHKNGIRAMEWYLKPEDQQERTASRQ